MTTGGDEMSVHSGMGSVDIVKVNRVLGVDNSIRVLKLARVNALLVK